MKNSPLCDKSFNFAVAVVKLHDHLVSKQKEYVISKQLIRSGTSIGTNIEEANASQSHRDFISKLYISSKESRESRFWLKLLLATEKITESQFKQLDNILNEITKMISSSISTAKKNIRY